MHLVLKRVRVSKIALHDYLDEIRRLLDDSHYEEAVAHCRHILQQYPRHIDTYRLLAEALVELEQYSEAMDLFQRVLSTDPNDFVAHVGLADLYQKFDQIEQAIWHLERAFEIEPYNQVIQDELRRLYKKHNRANEPENGVFVPERFPLTSGALARLYYKGEMYQAAILEIRQVLAKDPERIDLEVLLAESLWRDGQRVEAVETCRRLLEKLPNCVMANAIMAEIWLLTGRVEEAQQYIRRLQQLTLLDAEHFDVESVVGRALSAPGVPPLPPRIEVDFLEEDVAYTSATPSEEVEAGSPAVEEGGLFEWLEDIEADEELSTDVASAPVEASAQSDWFAELSPEAPEETALPPELSPEPPEDIFVDEEAPDWLQEAAREATPLDQLPDEEPELSVELPDFESDDLTLESEEPDTIGSDWLSGPDTGELTPPVASTEDLAELPEWLEDVAGDDFTPVQIDPLIASQWMGEGEEPGGPEEAFAADEEGGEWLAEVMGDEIGEAAAESDLLDIPAWLQDADEEGGVEEELAEATEERPFGTDELVEQGGAEVPAWLLGEELADLAGEEEPETAESASEPAFAEQEIPDWLTEDEGLADLAGEEEPETAESSPLPFGTGELIEQDGESIPAWLLGEEPDLDALGKPTEPPESEKESSEWPSLEAETWPENIEEPLDLAFEPGEPFDDQEAEEIVTVSDEEKATSQPEEQPDQQPEKQSAAEESAEELDWLEELAASEPQLSDTDTNLVAEELDEFELGEPDEELLPDWLQEEVDQEAAPAETLPAALTDQAQDEDASDEEEALSWLEELTAGQGAPVEEPPTLEWEGESPEIPLPAFETEPPENVDELDTSSWFESLLEEEQAEPFDEQPTAVFEPEDEEAPIFEPEPEFEPSAPDEPEEDALLEMLTELPDETSPAKADLEAPDIIDSAAEELDEAMSWLEELAASDDAPVDELPSLFDSLAAETEPPVEPETSSEPEPENIVSELVDEEMEEAVSEFESTQEVEMPDWLEELGPPGESASEPDLADLFSGLPEEETAEIPDWLQEEPELPELETPATETELTAEISDEVISEPPEDPEAAMAWLEELAARQGAPLEELPSLSQADESEPEPEPETAESEPVATLETAGTEDDLLAELGDAMSWLEELAAEQGVSDEIDREATADQLDLSILDILEDDSFGSGASRKPEKKTPPPPTKPEPKPEEVAEQMAAALDEDAQLAADLDWLEQVAMQNGASIVDISLDVADIEPPEDELADALDWLENVVLRKTAEPPATESKLATQVQEEQALDVGVEDMPEDPDQALAWLQQFAAEETTAEPETEVPPVEPVAPTAPPEQAIPDEDILASMPEDPDEAMAWLEELATLEGEEEAKDLFGTPETAESAAKPSPAPLTDEKTDIDDIFAAIEEVAESEPPVDEEPDIEEILSDVDPLLEGSDYDLPEWLTVDEETDLLPSQTGWLSDLPEPDIEGWLAAEDEVTSSDIETDSGLLPQPDTNIDTGPLPPLDPELEARLGLPPEEEETLVIPSVEPIESALHLDEKKLAAAREAVQLKQFNQALILYQELIEQGAGLLAVIADLETAVNENPEQPLLRRLLGDAYTRNGQLQKALETYRQALDLL
ncbi:MAG: tetratricopeptide repeat protein [Chloroflexi bacterium]|nr:MAG: tetratricopeptide repeat protein [Chloroflexota bacterium]